MPYYKDKKILFIHVPKTGGTIIERTIKKNISETLYSGRSNTLLEFPYNKTSLQHQFYKTIYKFRDKLNVNFDNIQIFSVVRNPYDRIISDLFWYKLIDKEFNSNQVYDVIKNNYLYRDDLDNHNKPQYCFLVDENDDLIKTIKLFHTEKLNELNDELNNFLGFNIDIKQKEVNKDYRKYLNNNSISLINNFYKKDFELFNYKLKT
jgi:hydroxymethylpyrimidine pyrophosphatase-like HAD family hydrolase